jgi:hypothetical protein
LFVVGEEHPGLARSVEDIIVVFVDGIGELVAAQTGPDIFNRIEFGRIGRQADESNVVGHFEGGSCVIAGAVEDECSMGVRIDLAADFGKKHGHGFGIGRRQDESSGGTPLRTDGPENIGPFVTPVAGCAWPCSPLRPDPRQRALLADARLILEPDFDWLALGMVWEFVGNRRGKVFLNVSCAASSV